jgi:colicin import membrane protein
LAHLADNAEAGDLGDDLESAANAISGLNLDEFADDAEPEGDEDSDEDGEDDNDQADDDEEQDDGDDEPETAIDAPVSLTAEEKAAFADLDPKSQRYVADLEARRAVQVQTATTKAAEAQRTAEASAARADAEARAVYAQQLKALGAALAPERPDPMLAQTNPAAYIAQQAQYDALKAQHDEFVQQAEAIGTEAQTAMSQAEIAERDRALMAIPEVANEATREKWFKDAFEAADVLGLDRSQMDHATAAELKALNQVAAWRRDAEKYQAATARNMQRVRDGKKTKTTKPNAAQPSSAEGRGYRESRDRLRQSGDVKDAAAAIARLGL